MNEEGKETNKCHVLLGLEMVIFSKNQVGESEDYSVACIIPWLK